MKTKTGISELWMSEFSSKIAQLIKKENMARRGIDGS
jgi:hypothetical protein